MSNGASSTGGGETQGQQQQQGQQGGGNTGTGQQQQGQGQGQQQNQQQGQQRETPATYDEWYNTLPADHKKLIDEHTTGLRNTVTATRKERGELETQLREISSKLKDVPDLQQRVDKLADSERTATRRADFYEAAPKESLRPDMLRAAFVVAQADGYFDEKTGAIDWKKFKADQPGFFAEQQQQQRRGPVNGGQQRHGATNQQLSGREIMNRRLRGEPVEEG